MCFSNFSQYFAALLFIFLTLSAQAGAPEFLVSGIFGGGDRGFIALVERKDGSHERIRAGDRIDGYSVDQVSDTRVKLTGSDGEVYLVDVKGARKAGGESADSKVWSAGEAEGPKPLPDGRVWQDLARDLRAMIEEVPRDGGPEYIGETLAPLLGLPEDAFVTELASGPPGKAIPVLNGILRQVIKRKILRLTIETDGASKRVMVFPQSDGSAQVMIMGPSLE